MVKLVTARESRRYGPYRDENRWEYINAGLYTFSSFLLFAGLAGQLPGPGSSKGGLVIVLIALAIVAVINLHDLIAHISGVDYKIELVRYDLQLGLVEFLVPFLQFVGSIIEFVGVLLLLVQADTGRNDDELEWHTTNCLVAGPLLWVIGSVHNSCQIYERANARTQILQSAVHVPFLMGSLLFFLGGFFNRRHAHGTDHQSRGIMAKSWAWLCMFGSLLFILGGLFNILKVFKMQQQGGGLRLEKLRGGAQERLNRIREGREPVIVEDTSDIRLPRGGLKPVPTPIPVLILAEPTQ